MNLRNIIFSVFFLIPIFAAAQVVPEPVQYTVTPEVPGPNQAVLIEVEGVGAFLGSANIVWSKDGAVVKEGVGESSYVFTTGAVGTRSVVRVTVQSAIEGTITREFVFNPSLVNLVWEADTTVPPLYKGKALYSAGSPLKIVAFPVVYSGSSRIAANALVYQWSRNGEPYVAQSGLGRSGFAFTGDQLKNAEEVAVDVYYGTSKVGRGSVIIPAVKPALVLYQRDALRGTVYDTAFPSSISLLGKEITVVAQPFYFSALDKRGGALTYAWQVNGEDATGPDAGSGILTLRQSGEGAGSAAVGVTLQNYGSESFVQNAGAFLELVFGQQTGIFSNLFGL